MKAFAIHLAISALIALAVIGLVFFIWYPTPLHTAVGVTQIFLILLAVDVVLGPLLTLLVYKVGKKTLVMDLTVIALLQLSALGYGLWTVAEGRPAWLVFSIDRFELVRINDIDERKLDEAATEYRKPSWFGPKWVAGLSPTNIEEKNELKKSSTTPEEFNRILKIVKENLKDSMTLGFDGRCVSAGFVEDLQAAMGDVKFSISYENKLHCVSCYSCWKYTF